MTPVNKSLRRDDAFELNCAGELDEMKGR